MNRCALMLPLPLLLVAVVAVAAPPAGDGPRLAGAEPLFTNDPKSPGILPPPSLLPGVATASPELENALKKLREEQAAFTKLRRQLAVDQPRPPEDTAATIKLRLQIATLLQRLKDRGSKPAEAPDTRGDVPTTVARPDPLKRPATPASDRLTLAQLLFRSQNFTAALSTLEAIDRAELPSPDRAWADYLKASCLRHLGKLSEALVLYRDVANSKQDAFLSETAAWQVTFIRWRLDMESKLKSLRQ